MAGFSLKNSWILDLLEPKLKFGTTLGLTSEQQLLLM